MDYWPVMPLSQSIRAWGSSTGGLGFGAASARRWVSTWMLTHSGAGQSPRGTHPRLPQIGLRPWRQMEYMAAISALDMAKRSAADAGGMTRTDRDRMSARRIELASLFPHAAIPEHRTARRAAARERAHECPASDRIGDIGMCAVEGSRKSGDGVWGREI
jgi:hypothetical protein